MSRARARFAALIVAIAAVVTAAPAAPAAAAPAPGINTHLLWDGVDADEVTRQLDWAVEAGATMVRVDVGWSSLQEHGPDRYSEWYLKRVDHMIAAANARGIKPLVTLTWTPCWASSAPADAKQDCAGAWWDRDVQLHPPTDAADYGRALAFVMDRYEGRVAAWELWNEPNSDTYFKGPDKAAAYAEMVRTAYPMGKAADASTPILAGSLMHADAAFTKQLFAHGIAGHFDGFSFHPYNGDRAPGEALSGDDRQYTYAGGVPLIRQTLADLGAAGTPLWLTEMGYSVNSTRGAASWLNGVSEETQAAYLKEAFEMAAGWSDVKALLWYDMRDTATDPADVWGNAGLRRKDGSARPSFDAFKTAAAATGAPVTPPAGGDAPVSGEEAAPGAPSAKDRKPRGRRKLRLRAKRRGGRVVVSGRAPRGGRVRVSLRRRSAGAVASRSRTVNLRVDRKGRFRRSLTGLAAGRWRVKATMPGARAAARVVRVV